MSSAIEVLKEEIEAEEVLQNMHKRINAEVSYKLRDALKEALLALEQKENYVIDFIKLEFLPKSKKEQFRVFFKDGTEQVFEKEWVGEQK